MAKGDIREYFKINEYIFPILREFEKFVQENKFSIVYTIQFFIFSDLKFVWFILGPNSSNGCHMGYFHLKYQVSYTVGKVSRQGIQIWN